MHAHAPVNYKCMTQGEWFGRENVNYWLDIPISKIRQVSSRSLRLPESQYVIISWKKSVGSDRNSRTGNEKREIRAGSKFSRPEREKAGNGKKTSIKCMHPIIATFKHILFYTTITLRYELS